MDIITKIIVQDIGAKSQLSTRKYNPMMAIDNEVEANWADYIVSRLLESLRRNHSVQTLHTFENDVMFRLFINYLIEVRMPVIDMGKELGQDKNCTVSPSQPAIASQRHGQKGG